MTTENRELLSAVTRVMGSSGDDAQLTDQEIRDLLGLAGDDWKNFGDMRTLGLGGVGEVFSVTEPGLRRYLAVKILRSEYRARQKQVENFIREARITAQIEHPNIVPVHRIGHSPEVGVYFTMKQIEGRDLRSIIRDLREKNPAAERFLPLNRRLEVFIDICQGIAFAHSKGVVHCDLKPANIMVGNFGEVMIMDWGLSVYRNEKDSAQQGQRINLDHPCFESVQSEEAGDGLPDGAVRVCGTPAFMSPEQASGRNDWVDEKSDIYGLGTILYCLLTLESAPVFPDRSTDDVLFDVSRGRIIRPRRRAPLRAIPRELEAIAMKALAFDRKDRYDSAVELLEDVRHYLEKFPVLAYRRNWFYKLTKLAMRRPLIPVTLLAAALAGGGVLGVQSIEEHSRMELIWSRVRHAKIQADAYYNLASRTFRNLQRGQAAVPETEFLRQGIEFSNYTNAALEGLAMIEFQEDFSSTRKREMLEMLCHLIHQQIKFCHLTGNTTALRPAVRQFQSRWRDYMTAIFEIDPALATILRSVAADRSGIILKVPENVSVMIREDDPDRKVHDAWQSVTPDSLYSLVSGSYLLRVKFPDGREAFFPVQAVPGLRETLDLRSLPAIPDGFAYVNGGSFRMGRSDAQNTWMRHLPAFFIQQKEVTIGDYLVFWKSIKDPELKKQYRAVYREAGDLGKFVWDENGVLPAPFTADMPVFGISGLAAEAYCRYLAEKTGLPYRLPTAFEWEKAARGLDGRRFVWGNAAFHDAAFTADHPLRAKYEFALPGGRFPMDRSVYGVWDMAGNLREIVRNPEDRGNIYRVMGGSCQLGYMQSTTYHLGSTNNGVRDAGFRCVIEIPQSADEIGF